MHRWLGGVLSKASPDPQPFAKELLLKRLAAYLQGDLDAAGTIWGDASTRHPEEPRLEIDRRMLARRRQKSSGA